MKVAPWLLALIILNVVAVMVLFYLQFSHFSDLDDRLFFLEHSLSDLQVDLDGLKNRLDELELRGWSN
jgi:hypothetical protein